MDTQEEISSKTIQVIIAHPDPAIRQKMTNHLQHVPDLVVIEHDHHLTILDDIKKHQPNVIVVDFATLESQGLISISKWRDTVSTLNIVVVDLFSHRFLFSGFRSIHADAYLSQADLENELVAAIQSVIATRFYFSANLAKQLMQDLRQSCRIAKLSSLSSKELYILVQSAQGKSNKTIAQMLHVSTKAISFYRYAIAHKLKLTTEQEIALAALINN